MRMGPFIVVTSGWRKFSCSGLPDRINMEEYDDCPDLATVPQSSKYLTIEVNADNYLGTSVGHFVVDGEHGPLMKFDPRPTAGTRDPLKNMVHEIGYVWPDSKGCRVLMPWQTCLGLLSRAPTQRFLGQATLRARPGRFKPDQIQLQDSEGLSSHARSPNPKAWGKSKGRLLLTGLAETTTKRTKLDSVVQWSIFQVHKTQHMWTNYQTANSTGTPLCFMLPM